MAYAMTTIASVELTNIRQEVMEGPPDVKKEVS